ncbi:hypothetical protein MAM1_0047d03227 [Mucor ambiguus]|uniref:Tho complex subunit 7 n=1 Tax=Mucor ambiguus TaxID=91626 RepID=A0A0C9ML02_9FUNG|nr:hypothetical protein MAM1_0047d03227 [Mucor ambiguus]
MEEEAFLKQRLALDDRHVKLLEKKYYNFLQTLYDEPLERAQFQLEHLLILLLNYQTSLERHPRIQAANTQEVKEYNDIVEKTAIIQSQAGTDIVTLKEDLVKAQKSRDQKLEYDRVAREIMKFETRNTYAESISDLQNDIALLEREKANKLQTFEDRKHNLTTLLESLKNLQKSVEDERALMTEDQKKLTDMERGYVSSDDEGGIDLSDNEEEAEEEEKEAAASTNNRFQERNDEEDEEEGILLDTPMVE